MATQTLHYHLTKPASADRVAVGDINGNSDTIDGYLYQANERADQLADDYNTSSTYNTGDYVRRDNYIYKCNADGTTGTWDATKWDRVKITEELGQGGGGSSTFAGLNDVNITGVQNGDIARYNSTTGKWEDSSDLTDLELSVSQLSSSVLSIAGDVDTLELTVSQMSASTLSYDANTSTKQKIDNVESNIPTSASDLPYSSTQSTKQAIDEKANITSLASVATSGDYRDLSHKIEVTRWMGNGTEVGTANQWSHISGGTIPASAIPDGFELYNLVSLYATSMNTSGWSRIVANVRALNSSDIAVSIYSTIALPVNQIQFRAIWTKNN